MAEDKISQRVSLFTNTLKTSYPQIYGGLTEQDFSAKIKSDPAFQKESYAALRALNKFSNLPESDSDYLKLFSSDAPAPQAATAKPVETQQQPAAEQPVQQPTTTLETSVAAQPAPMAQQPQAGQITEAEFNDDGQGGPVGVLAADKGPDLNQSMRNLVTETPKDKQEMASDAAKNAMDDERTFAQKWGIGGDVDMSMWEGFKQIVKNTLAGAENYLATGDRATIEALKKARQEIKEGKKPDLAKAYIDVNEERQQRLYKKAGEIQNDFQKRIGDLNIETSIYQQLKKGNFSRLPEATAYTVANSAMQIIPALFTYGGSSYLQTIPDSYKAGVDAIAQAKGVTPEEVIKSGDDAQLVARISAITQAALDYFGAGIISKSIATKGGYAAVRDWLIKKGMGKNFARALGLTYAGAGEGVTEALQEGVAITGEIGSPANSVREFISKFPKEFWTPENRERIYDSAIAGFIGGLGADAAGSTLRKATSPPESLGGIPTTPVSEPVQGQPIAPEPAPVTEPPSSSSEIPNNPAEPVEPAGPTGQPLTDDEIEGLSPGQKWKRFSGPDAGLSDIVGDSPIQVLHNGNGITYTAEKTGEEVDGVPIFNITSPDGKTTQVEGDIARFQVLPSGNETENGTASESENEPVTGTADGVVRGNDVVSTTGNTGEFSPEQKSDIRNAVPFTAAGWARKYFLEGGQVNTQSASKEVTGLRKGKGSKDVINGIIGHHSNKPDAPTVERIAEILRTRAAEEGIELDEQDLRDAVIQAIGDGKKSWMADQAKEVLPQSQWEPEGFELDYYFPKQEFPETPVHKFPGLNDEESKKLTDFVRERIPGGISKDGVIALSKLQGIAQEAAMNEVLGPNLAAKVQGLPVDTVQEVVEQTQPARQVDTDESVVKKLTNEHGEPESPQTEKERKKIFANTLLDTDNEDAAFHKAGYTLKDGIWFHPKGDGIKAWDALNDETKAILKKNNVRFIEDINDGIHAGSALIHQVGSGKDMRLIRGMALLYHGDHYVGGTHNHVAIHELGHSIWAELPQETKDLFNDGNPLSEHGKNVKKGEGKYGEAYGKAGGEDGWQIGEEDFADLFALNKGDLDKTIQDKKDQADKLSKEVANLQTQKPIVAGNAANENKESEKPTSTKAEIDEAAHQAATSPKNDLPEPTQAQKESGNYQLGHIKIQGLDISIENPEGSERKGVDSDGKEWSVKMKNHYGYIRGTEGADGDHVDVFIGPNPESDKVFVIDQVNQDGTLDEHKTMVGFDTEEEARKAYLSNYSKGWTGLGAITEMSMDDFKEWLKTEDPKKPLGDISARDINVPQMPQNTEKQEPTKEEKRAERDTELDEQKRAILERMRKRQGGQLNSGINPEDLADALEFIGLSVKGGAYKVADIVNDAAELLGEISTEMIRAIKAGYNAYRGDENTPDEISDQMDDEKTVRKFQFQKQDDDVSNRSGNGESNSNDAANSSSTNGGDVRGDRTGSQPNGGGTEKRGNTKNGESKSGQGTLNIFTPAIGEQSDQPLSESESGPRNEGSDAGTFDGRGNSVNGTKGNTGTDLGGGKDFDERTEQLSGSFADKQKVKLVEQRKAESIPVKRGDLENIRATLPYLLPEQQEDVLKAEQRFFNPEHKTKERGMGKGMLFTNGTGTGKTFTGLGIIKRFIKEGKDNILIVVPSQPKVTDWAEDGKTLGLNITPLNDTKTGGQGVVITTYANFRANDELAKRDFDLVVYDEAHRLMESKGGETSSTTNAHYEFSNKDERTALARITSRNPFWIKAKKLNDQIRSIIKIKNLDDTTDMKYAQLDDEQKKLESVLAEVEEQKREALPALQARAKKAAENTKVVFLSATPFKAHFNLRYANGFLFDWGDTETYQQASRGQSRVDPESRFMLDNFGSQYEWKYHRLQNKGNANPEAVAMQEIEFSEKLKKAGAMSGRVITSDQDYAREFPLVTGFNAQDFNRAFNDIFDYSTNIFPGLRDAAGEVFMNYNYTTKLFEALKTSAAIPRIQEHLNLGRKVVVFHRRKQSGVVPPFENLLNVAEINAKVILADENSGPNEKDKAASTLDQVEIFRVKYKDLLDYEQTLNYNSTIDQIQEAFPGKVAFINGDVSIKDKNKAIKDFNNDDSGIDVIVVQEEAGKEGISLHDRTGKHQRVLISMSMPISTTTALQVEGRIYRIGQESDAIFEYPLLGLDLETAYFGQNINKRLSTTENLAVGSDSRDLIRSYSEGVLFNATGDKPSKKQGKGGKEFDKRMQENTGPYKKARLIYSTNQKLRGKRDQREGLDFFPTPEPLGQKMVEWARLNDFDHMLEPSAGMGSIAMWTPTATSLTAVEPSFELYSKLGARAGGGSKRLLNQNFEDLALQNKYDAVVMNPPFGSGGKLAMDHVEKAFRHLVNGGRVVALIPAGPSMDKRLDNFLYGTNEKGNPKNPSAHLVADIKLPSVTFEQAGTAVSSRIVIIDRIDNVEESGMPRKVTRDLSDAKNIEDFFDQLENISGPDRKVLKTEAEKTTEETNPGKIQKAEKEERDLLDPEPYKNTKTGEMLTLVKPGHFYGPDKYRQISDIAKQNNGFYSRYVKGFLFKDANDAKKFFDKVNSAKETPVQKTDDAETNIGKPQKNSPEQRQKLVQSTLAVFSRLGSLTGSTMDIITDPNEIDRIKAAHKIGQIMRVGDEVLGFVHNGKVYVDPRVANEKTPIHEAGHVWLNFMEQTNPTFFDHGIRLIKEQPAYIKEAKRILNTTVESMPVYKEALALAIADEGARAQRISGTDKVKNFLRSMYEKIGKMFRINLTPDEISKLSFEDFTRSAAYWLTSGDPDLLDTQDPIMKQFLANQEKRILDKRSWLKKAISTLSNAMVAVSGLWRSMPYLRGVGFGEIKNILGQIKRVMSAAMVGSKAQVEAIYSGMTKDEADILGLYTNLLAIREEIAEGIHDDIPGDAEISFGITKDNIGQAVVDYAEKLDQNPAIRAAFETRKQIFKDLYQRGVDVGMYSADKGWEYYYRRIRQDAIESKYTNTLADLLRNAWRGRGNSTISTKKATTSVFKSREVFRGDFYTNSKEVDMDALVLMNIGIGIREKINRIKQVYQKDVLDAYLESQKVGSEMFKLETGRTRQTAITRIKKSIQPAIDSFFNSPIPPVDDRTDDIEMADMEVKAKLRAQKTSREWAKSFLQTMGSKAVEFGPREKATYGNLQQELYHKLYKAYRVIALNKISDPDVLQGISNSIKGLPSREFRKHYNKQVYARFLQMMEEKGFAAFYPEGFARQMGNKLLNNMAFDAGSQDVQDIIQRFNVDVNQAIAAYKTAATKDGAEVMWAPQEVVDTLNDLAPVTKNQMMENIKQGIRGFISKYKVFQLINPLNVVNYLFTNLTGNSIRYAEVGGNLAYLKKAIESLGNISAEERAQLMELNVLNSGDLTQDYTIGMTGFKTASGEQFSKLMSDVKAALLDAKSLSDAKDVFAQYLKERGVGSLFGDATDSYVGMARAMDNLFTDIYRYATYLKAIDQIRKGYTPNLGANLYDMMDIGTEQERAAYGASKAFGDYSSASRYMGELANYGILPYVRYMNTMVMQFYGQRFWNIYRRIRIDMNAGKPKSEIAAKAVSDIGSVVLGMTYITIIGQILSNMFIDDDDEEKRMLTDTGGDGIAFGKDPEGNNRMLRLGAPGQDEMRMLAIIAAYNHYMAGAGSKTAERALDDLGAEIYGQVGPMVKVPLSVATGKNKMYEFKSEVPTSKYDLFVRALPGNAVSRAGFNQIGALFGEDVEPTPDDTELILGSTPIKKTAYAMEIQNKVRELIELHNLTKPLPQSLGTEEQQDFIEAQRNAYKTLLLGKADEFFPRFENYVEKGGDIKTLQQFIERKNPLSRISKKNQKALMEFAFGGDGVIELAHTTPMMASEVFTEEDRKLIRLSLETWKEQDEKVYNTFAEALNK